MTIQKIKTKIKRWQKETWDSIIFIFKEPKINDKRLRPCLSVYLKFIHVNPDDLKNGVCFFHYKLSIQYSKTTAYVYGVCVCVSARAHAF